MPELPEVDTIAQDLRAAELPGSKITKVWVHNSSTVANMPPEKFIKELTGQTIVSIGRRGKYLVCELSKKVLIIHLRMTGRFNIASEETDLSKHEHIILELDKSRYLKYHDTRKFGRWYLVEKREEILGKLGPEPLEKEFTISVFSKKILLKKRQLKPLLLDQSFIAGLGNIYVDEALWEAKLHPESISNSLSMGEVKELHTAIQKVLKKGIAASGTTLGSGKTNYYRLNGVTGSHQDVMNVFRRTGKPCPRCEGIIVRLVVGQRSTHVCPNCQKK